jgi:uncharacterized protein with HEPN domain
MNKAIRVLDYLTHILDAIARIERYTAELDDFTFESDTQVQDAVIRNTEVIGEASNNIKRVDADFVLMNGHVPWSILYEMRNKVAHGYFKIDFGAVWRTIQDDLPPLKAQIQALVQSL